MDNVDSRENVARRAIDPNILRQSLENAQKDGGWKRADVPKTPEVVPPFTEGSIDQKTGEIKPERTHEESMEFFHKAIEEHKKWNEAEKALNAEQTPMPTTEAPQTTTPNTLVPLPERKSIIDKLRSLFTPKPKNENPSPQQGKEVMASEQQKKWAEMAENRRGIFSGHKSIPAGESRDTTTPGAKVIATLETDKNNLVPPQPPKGTTG